jgi:hypothetical protein
MLINTHLLDDTKIELCYDTSSDSSLVFIDIVIFYYSNLSIYQMRGDQKIRCQDLEIERLKSDICIELSIRILIIEDQYVILKKEFHIMSQLSCKIIIEIDIIKSFDIVSVWEKNEASDHVLIQSQHLVRVTVISTKSLRSRKINNNITNSTVLALRTTRVSKRTSVNVYSIETTILKLDHKQNIEVHHKSMTKEFYMFESIVQKDLVLEIYITAVHAVISNELCFLSVVNFEETEEKIRRNQLLDRIRRFDELDTEETLNFDYAKIFLEKYSMKNSKELDSNILFAMS